MRGTLTDSPLHPTQRALLRTQIESASLSSRLSTAQSLLLSRDDEITRLQTEISRLKDDRRDLTDAWRDSQAQIERNRVEFEQVNARRMAENRVLSDQKARLEETVFGLKDELTKIQHAHAKSVDENQHLIKELRIQLRQSERKREQLEPYQVQAHALAEELEALNRALSDARESAASAAANAERSGAPTPSGSSSDLTGESLLRSELKRQATHLAALEKNNSALRSEVAELRKRKDSVEMARGEMREVERKAKERIRILQEEVNQARREVDSLTLSFPSSSSDRDDHTSTEEVASLRHRLSVLSSAHSNCASSLSAHKTEISNLVHQVEKISQESHAIMADMGAKLEVKERELRWASEGRTAAERRLKLAQKELDGYKLQVSEGLTRVWTKKS